MKIVFARVFESSVFSAAYYHYCLFCFFSHYKVQLQLPLPSSAICYCGMPSPLTIVMQTDYWNFTGAIRKFRKKFKSQTIAFTQLYRLLLLHTLTSVDQNTKNSLNYKIDIFHKIIVRQTRNYTIYIYIEQWINREQRLHPTPTEDRLKRQGLLGGA